MAPESRRRARPAPAVIAALASGALVLAASPARAEAPAEVELHWSAPEGCPVEAEVRAAVERIAGRSLRSPGGPRVVVRVDATRAGSAAWTVRIALAYPDGAPPRERRIDGSTCAATAEAAEVAVAVALEPVGMEETPAAPEPAPSPPPPVVDEPPVGPPAPTPQRLVASPSRLRLGLRLLAGGDLVSLPAVAPGAEVAGLFLMGDNRVEIRGAAWLPEQAVAAGAPTSGAHIGLVAGGARYCRAVVQRAIALWGCGGMEGGALFASSFGVARPASGASPWVAPGLGALGLWQLSRTFSLAVAVEGLVPLVRESFEITGLGQLYRPPSLTGRGQLGLELHFPVMDAPTAGHSSP